MKNKLQSNMKNNMNRIKTLILAAFMVIASSEAIQAGTCTVQFKNSTGYTILQKNSDNTITRVPNGTKFNYTAIAGGNGTYNVPYGTNTLSLLASGGAPNYIFTNQSLNTSTCPSSSTVYTITLDEYNQIKYTASA